MSKTSQIALELSETILEDIEMEKISLSSIALRCMRLARIMNDSQAMQWFEYEISGYPKIKTGTLESKAFKIAFDKGRRVVKDEPDNKRVFSDLADELESTLAANQISLQSIRTNNISLTGDSLLPAVKKLNDDLNKKTSDLISNIKENKRRLATLRGNYYKHVLSVNYELKFSNKVDTLFDEYRTRIDSVFIRIAPDAVKKLDAIYDCLSSDNPESWSQCLTSCRRFFEDISNTLFKVTFPTFSEKKYQTKSHRDLDISGDKYINRLYAVVDCLTSKSPEKSTIGSHVIHIVEWIKNLHELLCKGVHSDISYEEAMQSVIHTYICMGDISALVSEHFED